ncbi:MAG: hypothetical protein R3C28_21630 [Pirellulaceae bacterium]
MAFLVGTDFGGNANCCSQASGTLEINGGEFGPDFDARRGLTLTINGGLFQGGVNLNQAPQLAGITNINGGRFEDWLWNLGDMWITQGVFDGFYNSGTVKIDGGEFERVSVSDGSNTDIGGGTIYQPIRLSSRNPSVRFRGSEFWLNGDRVSEAEFDAKENDILSGNLEDGSPFVAILPETMVELSFRENPVNEGSFRTSVDGMFHPRLNQVLFVDNDPGRRIIPGRGAIVNVTQDGYFHGNVSMEGTEITVDGVLGSDIEMYSSDLTVKSGFVATDLVLIGSSFTVEGGIVDFGPTLTNSKFSVAGGAFVGQATVIDSEVSVEGGLFGDDLAFENSRGRISGGSFGSTFIQGGEMEIAGGLFEGKLSVAGGTSVTIAGDSFALDGVPIEFGNSNEVIVADRNVVLTGQFENSEPIEFDLYSINRSNRDFFSNDAMVILRRLDSALLGDLNRDGLVDVQDLDMLAIGLRMNPEKAMWDVDQDGRPTDADRLFLIHDVLGTPLGDSNLDGRFDSSDFVQVFTAGLFETGDLAGWADGDWNGDGMFSTADLVAAFSAGGFSADVNVVPEPTGSAWTWLLLSVISIRRQLRTINEKNS